MSWARKWTPNFGSTGMGYNPKLFIGVCNSQEYVPSKFFWSWERMTKPYNYEIEKLASTEAVIRNNKMVREFLKSDCDIMVKMDIDQVYPENYFTVMVPLVEKYKVIGPLIYNKWRKNNYAPLIGFEYRFPKVHRVSNWESFVNRDGVLKAPYSHTNLFYARESLEGIEPPWYTQDFSEDGCGRASATDFSFIQKVLDNGYDIYINARVEVGHLVLDTVNTEVRTMWKRRQL